MRYLRQTPKRNKHLSRPSVDALFAGGKTQKKRGGGDVVDNRHLAFTTLTSLQLAAASCNTDNVATTRCTTCFVPMASTASLCTRPSQINAPCLGGEGNQIPNEWYLSYNLDYPHPGSNPHRTHDHFFYHTTNGKNINMLFWTEPMSTRRTLRDA